MSLPVNHLHRYILFNHHTQKDRTFKKTHRPTQYKLTDHSEKQTFNKLLFDQTLIPTESVSEVTSNLKVLQKSIISNIVTILLIYYHHYPYLLPTSTMLRE